MKKTKLLALIGTALVGLTQPIWAGPHGGGGFGGGFGGGGGGGRGHSGGFVGGGARAAPHAFGSARFSGRSFGTISRAPRFDSGGAGRSAVSSRGFIRQVPNRSISSGTDTHASGVGAINRQPDRVGSMAGRNRVSDPRVSTAQNREFIRNHAFARHDATWHRDWDKHRAHFHHNVVFVFIDGFWWGLYPWDYYPYYAYDYGYPYDYYDNNYDDQSAYAASDQYANNATVSAVQSALAKEGYYHGAIDGILGDETEAALARYQEDHDLSVTGTLTTATLQSLGLAGTAS